LQDLLGIGVLIGSLLRVDEVSIDDDLEYAAARRKDDKFRDLELELF
jgi:hypothetical protein